MSAAILGVLANAPAIIEFIQQAIALGINAWDQIVPMVQTDTAPTAQQWTALGLSDDDAHAKVQALTAAGT